VASAALRRQLAGGTGKGRKHAVNQRIYVGNLPFSASEEDVRQAFAAHGEVLDCHLVMDRETGRSRGFAFVEMSSADATEAIRGLDGSMMDGRPLKVNEARPREQSGGGGGGRGGRRY
jgi:cold-inducible RNA-binding protein